MNKRHKNGIRGYWEKDGFYGCKKKKTNNAIIGYLGHINSPFDSNHSFDYTL